MDLKELTADQIDNIKKSVLGIEKFCFSLSQINVPLNRAQSVLEGVSMLQQMHDQLLAKLGPEETAKFREEQQPQVKQDVIKPEMVS